MAPKETTATEGGMFAKDKEYGNRIDQEFEVHEPFILWGVKIAPDLVDTRIGKAKKTLLDVSRLDEPDTRFECATLGSAIAAKAEEASEADFPVVVELRKVPSNFGNEALVLQYVRDYS